MSVEASFDRALGAVADGQDVDWDAMERLARDEAERERVRCLRLLGEIGELHRTTVDPLDETHDTPVAAAPRAEPQTLDLMTSMAETLDSASGPTGAPRWGRYHLVEKVGTGGFGQVYRAWDPELERELAIKILHAHIADDSVRDRLRREGRALARIRQPNVVSVLGVEVHEGRAALCMEFVRGHTLDELVHTRGTFSAREAVLIGEDVCRALAAVHRAGYLHRDVKAKNVMREQAGRTVLMDFGTGREEQAPGHIVGGDMTGTPLYMAPEVLAGRPASMRSDVYSVGVLLFHLVSAGYPVQARGASDLKAAHRDGRRRFLSEWRSDLPAGFVRVVDRALAPQPEDRYPNAAALLEALGHVLGDDEPPRPTWRALWMRRVFMWTPLAIFTLLALGSLTSAAFNVTLGRAGFVSETLWDRLRWGLKASVPPAFLLLLGWLAHALVLALWRVSVGMSGRARSLDERVRARLASLTRDAMVFSSAVLLFSASALVVAWLSFRALLMAMMSFVRFAPAETIAILGPEQAGHHDLYVFVFSALIVVTLAAWYAASRVAARHRVTIARSAVAGAIVVVSLQLASLGLSYRMLIHNALPAVRWQGETCYVTGERGDRWLLFCPARDTDRSEVVRRGDPGVVDLQRLESPFTGIDAPRGSR